MHPNIIFILVDALRIKNLGCYGYEKSTSPNVDSLVNDSLIFSNCFSTTNTTDPSISSILSGKYPSGHGIITHGVEVKTNHIQKFIDSGSIFLQEILRDDNYHTIAIDYLGRWHKIGFDEYLPEDKKSNLKRWFKKVLSKSPNSLQRIIRKFGIRFKLIKGFSEDDYRFLEYLRDKEYTKLALDTIKKRSNEKKPFFLFVHYWSVHMPYEPPQNYLDDLLKTEYKTEPKLSYILDQVQGEFKPRLEKFLSNVTSIEEMLARYDACVKFADNEIGMIISTLKKEGIYDDSIIIITSDHGESLVEHGIYFDHHGLYEESIHVPLIIKFPKFRHKKINAFIQHIDIVPTILEYLNIPLIQNMDGISFLSAIMNEDYLRDIIYSEENHTEKKKSIRTKNFKYIFAESDKDAYCRYCGKIHTATEELYNLRLDPFELKNLAEEKPELSSEFRKLLEINYNKILERNKINVSIKNLKKIRKL